MPANLCKIPLVSVIFLFGAALGSAQNADSAKSKQPVAIVEGETIYYDDLVLSLKSQLLRLRSQEYDIKRKALDNLIEQKLLEVAARKKGITTEELIAREVGAKIPEPTEPELQAYYLGQKDRLNRPYEEVKDQLRQGFKQARVQQARQEYLKGLWKGDVLVLLTPPKVQVAHDPARLRGNPNAPVMIVEFSDFQCPYCRKVEDTLKELLAKYKEKVSLAYRDLPLTNIHPQAEQAAEASRCAGEQGKFWEYHDQLFKASSLEHAALVDYARTLKIDEKRFDSCLTSQKYKAEVQQDLQEGTQAGVSGTPGFFVNGVPLSGAQSLDNFVDVIEDELARKR